MIQPKSHEMDNDVQYSGIPAKLTGNSESRIRPTQIGTEEGHYKKISGIEYPTAMST
jgi:hypothetical protein